MTNQCVVCGNPFTIAYRFREQKTCGLECAKSAISKTLTTSVVKQCLACGNDYKVVQSYKDDAKYCSYKCFLSTRDTRQPDVTKTCEYCKQGFVVPFTHKDQRFCGHSCASSGENNAFYGIRGAIHPKFGKPAWNNGQTIHTDPRLRVAGEKISAIIADKIVSGTFSPPSTGFKGEHYVGLKNGGETAYLRSSYESTYVRMLDADPEVVSWEYEPFRIPYIYEGSLRNYVPDFLVSRVDNSKSLVEVKPALVSTTSQNQAKARAAESWCALNGVTYVLVTEDTINV